MASRGAKLAEEAHCTSHTTPPTHSLLLARLSHLLCLSPCTHNRALEEADQFSQSANMVAHNNVIPNGHWKKKWCVSRDGGRRSCSVLFACVSCAHAFLDTHTLLRFSFTHTQQAVQCAHLVQPAGAQAAPPPDVRRQVALFSFLLVFLLLFAVTFRVRRMCFTP